ncbi:DUF2057 family protein [Vibrio amylolyticus]|uniref:DUF2057 family protein n=1 Tax=Vibrio amylolyticus TaxID=2847292 RepID=UPI0035525739
MKMCRWLILCLFSVSTSAAVLVPSQGVSVLYINGEAAEEKIGKNDIATGEAQIIIRMDKKLGKGNSSEVFTSDIYVLNLEVSGTEIKVNHPVARSLSEAKKAFRTDDPKWRVSEDGKDIAYSQALLPKKKGIFPYMGLEQTVLEFNQSKGVHFANGKVTTAAATTTAAVASNSSSSTDVVHAADSKQVEQASLSVEETTNLDQLKAWYLKATKSERKEFRRWVIDQE